MQLFEIADPENIVRPLRNLNEWVSLVTISADRGMDISAIKQGMLAVTNSVRRSVLFNKFRYA